MELNRKTLIFLVAIGMIAANDAQLTRDDKQYLLNEHNKIRRSRSVANMRLMEWSSSLASIAESAASTCSNSPTDKGILLSAVGNKFSWVGERRRVLATATGITNEFLGMILRCWSDPSSDCHDTSDLIQLLFPDTFMLGCGAKLYTSADKCHTIPSGLVLVCFYGPGSVGSLSDASSGDPCSNCPTDAPHCVTNLCHSQTEASPIPADKPTTVPSMPRPYVYKITPNHGSWAGGTLITLEGIGFSSDQFNRDNPNLGNTVTFHRGAHVVPCNVETYYTSTTRIVCRTSAIPQRHDSNYGVTVTVDGKSVTALGGRLCGGYSCAFYYRAWATPTIYSVTPLASIPSEIPITLNGRVFSYKISDAQQISNGQTLDRMIVGGELCDPRTEDDDTTYGGKLTGNGYGNVRCRPEATRIDSMNATIFLSKFGRSLTLVRDFSIDNKLRQYLYQTHSDITMIEPNSGSPNGGTLITIYGKHLYDPAGDVKAYISGVPCKVVNYTNEMIQCITEPAPPESTVYPGARGIVREVWTSGFEPNLHNLEKRPYGYPDSTKKWTIQEKAYRDINYPSEFGELYYFNQRYSGFFVPPMDSYYTFNFISDDYGFLYLSPNTSREHKKLIGHVPGHADSWNKYGLQTSSPIYLEAGQSYYIEAINVNWGGGWNIGFGAKIHNLSWTSDRALADHEIQAVEVTSAVIQARQEIAIKSSPKIQVITLLLEFTEELLYQLSFNENATSTLTEDDVESTITSSLNDLQSVQMMGSVVVKMNKSADPDAIELTIIFISEMDPIPDVYVINHTNYTSTISQPAFVPSYFTVGFDSIRQTDPIPSIDSPVNVSDKIIDLFATKCQRSGAENIFFINSYETGSHDNTVEPYCGRFSNKNPTYIFRSGILKDDRTNSPHSRVTLTAFGYKYVCFAYYGVVPYSILRVYIVGNATAPNRWININIGATVVNNQWTYKCTDVYSKLHTMLNNLIGTYVALHMGFHSRTANYWIDEMMITTAQPTVIRLKPAVRPNGIFVNSVAVQENFTSPILTCHDDSDATSCDIISTRYIISFQGHFCRNDVPLVSSSLSYVQTTELVEGSNGISGTFDLIFENKTVRDIPATATASKVKELLERHLRNDGSFHVTGGGNCVGSLWKIKWNERGGDLPLLVANGTKLKGKNTQTNVMTVLNGGVWIRPFRGDMLRLPELQPQVQVVVNGIPASCRSANCSFTFTNESTPTIDSIVPQVGGQDGTPIHVYGGNFINDTSKLTVSIANKTCEVIFANETIIKCIPSPNTAGSYKVSVHIDGIGYSITSKPDSDIFHYSLMVESVTPNVGSLFGSNSVTLTGKGFPIVTKSYDNQHFEDFQVLFDDYPCFVVSSNLTTSTCKLQPHLPSVVNVTVIVNGRNAFLHNGYEYSIASTATITSISPSTGPSSGGALVSITGYNFDLGNDVTVEIGPSVCNITFINDTLITCITTMTSPGKYLLLVTSETFGVALHESLLDEPDNFTKLAVSVDEIKEFGVINISSPMYPQYEFEFRVTDISPCNGSVMGGTELTIKGYGFTACTTVSVGMRDCNVTSATYTEIKCKTPSTRGHRIIDNSGTDEILGPYFSWVPNFIEIEVGDTVQWQWTGSELSIPRAYEVHQSISLTNPLEVGGGFKSDPSIVGDFTYIFTQPGTYYYASYVDDQCLTCTMSGTIVVNPLRDITADVRVTLNKLEALYDHLEECSNSDSENSTDDCLSGQDTHPPPVFIYSEYLTPMVDSLEYLVPYVSINGSDLGDQMNDTAIWFGGHSCRLISHDIDMITCHFSITPNVQPLVPLPLLLFVSNHGNALLTSPALADRTLTVIPSINSVQPMDGSVLGGNVVILSGIALMANNLSVFFGSEKCHILSVTFDSIECTVPQATSVITTNSTVNITVTYGSVKALCNCSVCMYTYALDKTPTINNIWPVVIGGIDNTNVTITGDLLEGTSDITVGPSSCFNVSDKDDDKYTCLLQPLQAGEYPVTVLVHDYGYAMIESGVDHTITSVLRVNDVTPNGGSYRGGTTITVTGIGFSRYHSNNTVTIGNEPCTITASNYTSISCVTPDLGVEGNYTVDVAVSPATLRDTGNLLPVFTYDVKYTSRVLSVSPAYGQKGDMITINGSLFSDALGDMSVTIGSSPCAITFGNETMITCTLGINFVGEYDMNVIRDGLGRADGNVKFTYILRVAGSAPNTGSYAGMSFLTITGIGFNPIATFITICNVTCTPSTNEPSLTSIQCIIPSFAHLLTDLSQSTTKVCNVTVSSLSTSVTLVNSYTFDSMLTPYVTSINRTRGGTAGGSRIELTGTNIAGDVNVTIAGAICSVISNSNTNIVCITGPSGRTIKALVMVFVGGKGFAINENVEFFYVDLWSSIYTWGGTTLPTDGDFVVVPSGQTLVLDIRTPVLKIILIQGGQLIFEDEEDGVELHSEHILITDGGLLQVGTEDVPYQHKARIVLYGHVLSTEIPLFGAKTLAVRNGTLDLHGKPIMNTWAKLSRTARAGDTTIHLTQNASDWGVGSQIVIATTSHNLRETEELTIADISGDGMSLSLTTPLKYTHIAVTQTIGGRVVETSAEVGLLTRNVVVRGNRNTEWDRVVEDCQQGFDPGQFAVQTCFEGRFGSETIGDQFGSQIMIHKGPKDKVIGRIEYIEVTHAGQAFRLGRYPIHFHLSDDVNGSYVRGCGIHHTFNRACTIHAVDNLLVEKNVAYNVLGHAYFLEDGIEQHNIIQYNLGIFVRASSSLLNVDITPATYWVVNPSNILRHNAAAGGTHFGYWYRLPVHPTGPSATNTVRPRNLPLTQFTNNSAHSFGWYGIWVFPSYHPVRSDTCRDVEPAVFDNYIAWRTVRGIEFLSIGAVQVKNSIFLDNVVAGIEYISVTSTWGDKGALVENSLFIGHSAIRDEDGVGRHICTSSGIKLPGSSFLTVSNVTFVNFDESCSALQSGGGSFEARFKGLSFENSPNVVFWKSKYEFLFRDLDGSLSGIIGGSLIPTSEMYPRDNCTHHVPSSHSINGSVCNAAVEFTRFNLDGAVPFGQRTLMVSNVHGSVNLTYIQNVGYLALIPLGTVYELGWEYNRPFKNISYTSSYSGMKSGGYLWIKHDFNKTFHGISINNQNKNSSLSLPPPGTSQIGDYYVKDNSTSFTYFVKGINSVCPFTTKVNFRSYQCFYKDCIAPSPPPPTTMPPTPRPPGPSNVTYMWSNASIWPSGQLPGPNSDVHINESAYIYVDVPLPQLRELTIAGVLEFLDTMDHFLEADIVLIDGGRLVAGSPQSPFQHKLTILLNGELFSEEYLLPNYGPTLGAKALGVFGELELHGEVRGPTWTMLAETATAGSNEIVLSHPVDWLVGDEIVVASTSFESLQAEKLIITDVSSDKITLTVNKSLTYNHFGQKSNMFDIGAEVGLLTRNIKFIGTHPNATTDKAEDELFGCRVLVSTYVTYYGDVRTGTARFHGVEFEGCGQDGFFDPRYSLVYINVGDITNNSSYVTSCSFHDGYSAGLGAFGSNALTIANNVFHKTIGPSLSLSGSGHSIINNLAVVAYVPGLYKPPIDTENSDWTANFELAGARGYELIGNSAAGGSRAGFHTNGESCVGSGFVPKWRDNVAHSALHGIHLGYGDGHTCSAFNQFTVYSCYHYGFFSFSPAGIRIMNSTFINNYAATFTAVIGPSARSHRLGRKSILIENTLIMSTFSDINCNEYYLKPQIANHKKSFSAIKGPGNSHVGIVMTSFTSGGGKFSSGNWIKFENYPAINGHTRISNVTFANFHMRCSARREAAIITNPLSEDCQHPLISEKITLINTTKESLFFGHRPHVGSVNPSDCVDMDCDGLKKILIKDLDGSLTQTNTSSTIISQSEFEWNGDRRRGLGDYRIPRTMLATPTGNMIPTDSIYPNKGIYRGNEGECQYQTAWNSYLCRGIDHMMLVLESLDGDTEVRRLSPIGVGASGYIDLVNGPQDQGWCGGYTCQERISTFYLLVATGLNYTIALTSTNPQTTNLILLNANETQSLSVAIIYTTPQRLDVYVGSNYIIPTNGYLDSDGNLRYTRGFNFKPVIGQPHGTNYYNRVEKKLYIIIRGREPVRIVTTSVIQLGIDLPPVTVTEFFEVNLITNLALLLGIPTNRIRIVNVVSEGGTRKRQTETTRVEIEIGDAPSDTITTDDGTTVPVNATDPYNNVTSSGNSFTVYNELVNITTHVAEVIQTGELSEGIGLMVLNADITEPIPPVVDPTGGVRATNLTGGPQPGDPGTANLTTYSMRQRDEEERKINETVPITLNIPSTLSIVHIPSQSIEGLKMSSFINVAMLDYQGNIVENLGIGKSWELTISVVSQPHVILTDTIALMDNGLASFDNLTISHPGTYRFHFRVSYPTNVNFNITSLSTMTVTKRYLDMIVVSQPKAISNTTFPIPFSFEVHVVDRDSRLVANTGWRQRQWYMTASLISTQSNDMNIMNFQTSITHGIAMFGGIYIRDAGMYKFRFTVSTDPQTPVEDLPVPVDSEIFEIVQYQSSRYFVTYNNSYNDTVKGYEIQFIEEIESTLYSAYPDIIIYNTSLMEGSIVLTFFATSHNINSLVLFNHSIITTSSIFSITFRGTQLSVSSVVQDSAYPIYLPPTQNPNVTYVIATVMSLGVVLGFIVAALLLITFILCLYCVKKKAKGGKAEVQKSNEYELQRTATIYSNNPLFSNEDHYPIFHLVSDDNEKVGVVIDDDDDDDKGSLSDKNNSKVMQNDYVCVNYAEVKVMTLTSKADVKEEYKL